MRNARISLTKSNQEFDIVSIQSTRFANTCILRGTVRNDNIDMDDREIYLAGIPVDDSPIVRLRIGQRLTILPTLRTTSRYPRSLPVGKMSVRPISDIARAISHRFY